MDLEYPHFGYVENRGHIFPEIDLPSDYLELVPIFYEQGGREKIEDLARNLESGLEDIFGKTEIKLKWDHEKGLTNISLGPSGGFDLNQYGRFQEHNLGTKTSLMAGAIVMNYVYELLRSRPE
ncbi:MAG: hypothetical protein Q8P81_02370 [Nanoarchaeota archaeon]|nr:hypothetical protein [Nanoarchaeota archaeon]